MSAKIVTSAMKQEQDRRSLRSCGRGVVQDIFGEKLGVVPGVFTEGAAPAGRLFHMHDAVASKNQQAAKKAARLDATVEGLSPMFKRGTTGKRVGKHGSIAPMETDGQDNLEIDAQALAAEFLSVEAALRTLMSDNPDKVVVTRSVKENEAVDEDDGDNVDELRKRLLRYKFVRKIEEPPPPLQSLDELPPEAKSGTDKIERNKQNSMLSWVRSTKSRVCQRNQERQERTYIARQRRESAEFNKDQCMAERLAELEMKTEAASRPKLELQDRVQQMAAIRNARLEEAKQRHVEFQARKKEQALENLDRKEARSGTSSALPTPRAVTSDSAFNSAPTGTISSAAQPQQQAQAQPSASAEGASADGDSSAPVAEEPKVASVFELFEDLEAEEEEAAGDDAATVPPSSQAAEGASQAQPSTAAPAPAEAPESASIAAPAALVSVAAPAPSPPAGGDEAVEGFGSGEARAAAE